MNVGQVLETHMGMAPEPGRKIDAMLKQQAKTAEFASCFKKSMMLAIQCMALISNS